MQYTIIINYEGYIMKKIILFLCANIFLCAFLKFTKHEPPTFLYKQDNALYKAITTHAPPIYPQVHFAVLSDTHIYDTSLGIDGKAFNDYINNDRKMLIQSEEILESALHDIALHKPQFLLISGDLTKDGEISSHKLLQSHLYALKAQGIQTFVVPGNHDINNAHALSFHGETTKQVPSAQKEDFEEIYADFGYKEAIQRDPNSLSYIIEPIKGLYIFALDSTMWRENTMDKEPIVARKFYPQTLQWIETQLIQANKQGKAIIAFFHHGILEHYNGNATFYPEYLIEDFQAVANMFAFYNVRLIFTGHFHANDISMQYFDGKPLYDIETGSLVSAPSPYRFVTLQDNKAIIKTSLVTKIPSIAQFQEFATAYTKHGFEVLGKAVMDDFFVSKKDQNILAPYISNAFMAHYRGDETPMLNQILVPDSKDLGLFGKIVLYKKKDLILSIWHDLKPHDNNVTLNLNSM